MSEKAAFSPNMRPVSYFFLFLTLVMTFLSFATNFWYKQANKDTLVYYGIWRNCIHKLSGDCQFLPEPRDESSAARLTAARALFSMSIMHLVGAVGYPPFFKQMSTGVIRIGIMALLSALAGLYSVVAMGIMTLEVNHWKDSHLGYSYFMGWSAAGLAFVAASLIYIASKDNTYNEPNY